ncbi:hypothetical protein A3C86_03210 [Candidatus Kaiserbacteria bacterium RIFCSPHIGHO2_02_FULL_49_16]|uniref:Uncharacterized protein n=1 Tax=Candidatus Kaiserbacteria bacterium RIFCSPHIGHO2_02_FULL_49_16 TaxID=1798490 RepID=A0A1F6DF45_9BACT|nr:MAG: hypothetical protein A3C86_03210 [Candidatus Kaiserbacteria bacterium RIFCSPHIGHO2_02_FULL_49_16]
MVLKKAVDNLRGRPHHERRAVARGSALVVVGILFLGWVIWFFNNITANGIQIEPIQIPKLSAFNTESIIEARKQVQDSLSEMKNRLPTPADTDPQD